MLYGAKRDHQYHGYVQTITTPMEESRQEFLVAPNICKSWLISSMKKWLDLKIIQIPFLYISSRMVAIHSPA